MEPLSISEELIDKFIAIPHYNPDACIHKMIEKVTCLDCERFGCGYNANNNRENYKHCYDRKQKGEM